MRAHTIATKARPRRKAGHIILALALGVSALAIPVGASASPADPPVDNLAAKHITSGSRDSSRPGGGSDYSFVNSITPPASEQSSPSASGEAPLNGEPTFVSGSPAPTGDGFDWASAAVGAGAVLALLALGGAALLTVRGRTAMSPTSSASSRRGARGDAGDGR